MTHSRTGWFLLLILHAALVMAREEPPVKPTIAHNASAKVTRGGDIQITLDAIPSYGREINFQIKNPPLHGTLSELRPSSNHSASVTYHHDGTKVPLSDEFSFRAQANGQAMSESVRCRISIIPPPASLLFDPPRLDFGKLMLSEKRQLPVTLINQGGTRAEGRLILPRGFSAPLGDRYTLDEGANAIVSIEFDPMEVREYSGQAVTQPFFEKTSLDLHGIGIPRFVINKLSPCEWEVGNLTGASVRISCTGGGGWVLPSEVTLPADESRIIAFQEPEIDELNATEKNTLYTNTEVKVTDGLSEYVLELPPLVRFVPAVVQAVTPPALGTLPLGATVQLTFSLINRSEFPKKVNWRVTSPSGGGSDTVSSVKLKGGESREITYGWKPSLPGDALIIAAVTEGRSTRHELVWKAVVKHSSGGGLYPIEDRKKESIAEMPQDANVTSRVGVSSNAPPIPPMTGAECQVVNSWSGGASVLMKWDSEGRSSSRFRVLERELLLLGSPEIKKDVHGSPLYPESKLIEKPITVDSPTRESGRDVVTIRKLAPGWHELLISRLNSDGSIDAQSHFRIRIPGRNPSWKKLITPLEVSVFGLLLLYFYLLRRKRS